MWRELGPSVLPVEPGPDKNPGCSWWVFKFILSIPIFFARVFKTM